MNGSLPERIVVFRDGVGDGQMHTVSEYEVPQISSCLEGFGADYQPKLAVVVVQKRISTRIFYSGDPKGLTNPQPGTIVDHTITRRGWYVSRVCSWVCVMGYKFHEWLFGLAFINLL